MPAPDHVEQFVFVITSRSFAASYAFYSEVLGLELIEEWSEQGHGAVFSAGGPARVELIDVPDAAAVATSDTTFIGLQVTDIDPVHARARAGGHEIVREPAERPWGGRGFVVRDPNGVAINVYTAYRTTGS
jgi:catechol 2,3-dioxygenase-like lactoylglutathione lyase family enzyme